MDARKTVCFSMGVHRSGALRLPGSVVTIGAFDGVHRGHQALILRTIRRAARVGVPSVVYTFDPPPKAFLRDAGILTPLEEKIRRLGALGLDHVVVAAFDEEYALRSAEDFLDELAALSPVEVWVGPGFRFGREQSGDPELIATRFATRVFEPVTCEADKVISSSRVRTLMARGAHGEARELLGWSA